MPFKFISIFQDTATWQLVWGRSSALIFWRISTIRIYQKASPNFGEGGTYLLEPGSGIMYISLLEGTEGKLSESLKTWP